MGNLLKLDDLGEVFDLDDRRCQLLNKRHALAGRCELTIHFKDGHRTSFDEEIVDASDGGAAVLAALDAYFARLIDELERDIRAKGVEPSEWVAPEKDEAA